MKLKLSFLLFLSLLFFTSCEDIIECIIINRRPELPEKTFQQGYVNDFYYDEFDAHIKNEPSDNDYSYEFEIEGELPYGIIMSTDFRTLIIEGTPQFSGTFTFEVFLYVDHPLIYNEDTDEYESPLCAKSTSKEYTIIIN